MRDQLDWHTIVHEQKRLRDSEGSLRMPSSMGKLLEATKESRRTLMPCSIAFLSSFHLLCNMMQCWPTGDLKKFHANVSR